MKIGIYYDIITGGAKRSVYEFSRHLKSIGHRIDIFAPLEDYHFLVDKKYADARYDFSYKPFLNFGEKTLLFSPFLLFELFGLLKNSKKIAKKIDKGKYDIIFVHNSRYTQCPIIIRYIETPTIYYCHEPFRFINEPHPYYEVKREWIRKSLMSLIKPNKGILYQLEMSNLKKAKLILSNSFFTMENLYRCYGIYSIPSYQGVDHKKFIPMKLKKENYVISVGQLNRWKGQEFLIKSIAKIPQKNRPKLYLIYDKYANHYKRHINNLALKLHVRVNHFMNINEDKLVELYNRSKGFVYAPVMEPFGLAPLEAMACGVPVVAVKEGGVRETILSGETGYLTRRDLSEFAEAVSKIINSDQLCKRLGNEARNYVINKWSWHRSAKEVERHMEQLIKK